MMTCINLCYVVGRQHQELAPGSWVQAGMISSCGPVRILPSMLIPPIQPAFCSTVQPRLRQDDKHELSDSHSFPHAQGHFYGEDSWHGVMVTERKTHFLQWLKWLIYIAAFKDHCNVDHVAFQGCNKADPSRKPAMEGGFSTPRLVPGTPISSHPRAAVQRRTSAGCC